MPVFLQAYKTMSNQKTVPKGLREQEVERGNFKKPPIPYIPVEDEVGEKVKNDVQTFKVKIDNTTTVNASVWTGGNPKGFLIHIISTVGYIERSKLFKNWTSQKTQIDKYSKDVTDYNRYISIQNKELKKAQEEAKKAATAPAAPADDDDEGMIITPVIPADISKKVDSVMEEIERWK